MGQPMKVAYRFDKNGWLVGECFVQFIPQLNRYNVPDDCTMIAPGQDRNAYWYKYDTNSNVWTAHKKPTTAAECVDLGTVDHYAQEPHEAEARALMQSLVKNDSGYKIERGKEDLSWTTVKIPEKTAEELALEEKKQARAAAQSKLSQTDYVAAKIAEGAATKEEYAEVLAQRQAWRDEINALDPQIESLTATVAAAKEAQNV